MKLPLGGPPLAGSTLGLLFALPHESGPLRRRLVRPRREWLAHETPEGRPRRVRVWRARLGCAEVVLAHSGAGNLHSAATAEALIQRYRLRGLLCLGFAGGLDPLLRPGGLVEARQILSPRGARSAPGLLLPAPSAPAAKPVLLVSLDHVLVTREEKAEALCRWGAAAADMESLGAAEAADSAGIPWQVVRAVTDPGDEDMPLDFNLYLRDGRLQTPRIVAEALPRPRALLGLLRLGLRSSLAARELSLWVIDALAHDAAG